MKKFKKILLTVLCVVTIITLTGCKNKTAITAEDFKSRMESKGYNVQDATNQFSSNPEVKKVYIALNSNYQIEFYEIDTLDNAVLFYNNNNKNIFEQSKSNVSSYTSKELANYAKYRLNTSGKYKVVSRIDNTVIYLNVNDTYKKDVDSILNSLGY